MKTRSTIYSTNIDITNIDSTYTLMFSYIEEHSMVLDVGCACGDFGIALNRHKNTINYGFEYDSESVKIALSTNAYENVYQIDLDAFDNEDFKELKNKFDYIVCGDILEHLRYPNKAINKLKYFLKDDGFFVMSIPNISHASIKANLLLNDFTYTPTGLLDETHIHFFTYKSIAELLSREQLTIAECRFTKLVDINGWQTTNPYLSLNPFIQKFLFSDWHSFVAQYIIKVQVSDLNKEILLEENLKKLDINKNNAPEIIKKYRKKSLIKLFSFFSIEKIIKENVKIKYLVLFGYKIKLKEKIIQ